MCCSPYRAKAQECLGAAERARDPATRLELFRIAAAFLLLAFHQDSHAPPKRDETARPHQA